MKNIKSYQNNINLDQWFSIFLILWHFMLWWPPTIKLFSFLLHNCNFATIMYYVLCNVNICGFFLRSSGNPCESFVWPQSGHNPQVENHRLRWSDLKCFRTAESPRTEQWNRGSRGQLSSVSFAFSHCVYWLSELFRALCYVAVRCINSGLERGLVVKSTCCFCRGLRFSF